MSKLLARLPLIDRFVRRPPFAYAAAREFIEQFEGLDLDGREGVQAARLRGVLETATRTPHYRSTSVKALASVPVLSKAQVRTDPASFEAPTRLPKSRGATSGTSGTPLRVARSLGSVVFEQAAIDWVVAKGGRDFGRDRVAVLRGADVKPLAEQGPPYWRVEPGGRVLTLSTNHLAPRTAAHFVDALNAFRPSILYAYPSAAEYLARLCVQENLRFEVPLVVTSSEMYLPSARTLVSETFRARTVDYYGQAERAAFAYSVDGDGYRFLASYGVVELEPVDRCAGDASYEVVGTNLHNTGQVLLRYRSGDSVQLNPGQTDLRAVRLGVDSFPRLEGRLDDVLVGSEGQRYVGIDHIPRSLERYGRFQFVQTRPDHVVIQVEGAAADVVGEVGPVMDRARLKLPPEFEIEVAFVDQLARTPAGKTPFVLRSVG